MSLARLLPHQERAVAWLVHRETTHQGGSLLSDDPGLGKTVMSLAVFEANPVERTLVVCPKSVKTQWALECSRFTKGPMPCALLPGEREALGGITLCSYGMLVACLNSKKKGFNPLETHWDRVVLDEAHVIKNPRTKTFQAVMRLSCDMRLGLTGTPIQNCRTDWESLKSFLRVSGDAPFMLRRTLEDVPEICLPTLSVDVRVLDLDDSERIFYNKGFELARLMARKGLSHGNTMEVLEALLRCRQMCVHPKLFVEGMAKKVHLWMDEDHDIPDIPKGLPVKARALKALLETVPSGEKAIVFCSFVHEMVLYRTELGLEDTSLMFHGSLNDAQRVHVLQRFRDDPSMGILFVQIQAGGTGLNLQVANWAFVMSPQWNPTWEVQALGRVYRHGQFRPVQFIRMVVKDTIEDRIWEIQERKLQMIASTLEDPRVLEKMKQRGVALGLTRGDLRHLFKKVTLP